MMRNKLTGLIAAFACLGLCFSVVGCSSTPREESSGDVTTISTSSSDESSNSGTNVTDVSGEQTEETGEHSGTGNGAPSGTGNTPGSNGTGKTQNNTTKATSNSGASSSPVEEYIPNFKGATITIKANWYVPDKFNKTTTGKAKMKQIASIEEKFNCQIQLANINWGTFDQMMLAGQPECDILGTNPGRSAFYYTNNMLYPLDDLGVNWNASHFDKTFNQTMIIDGKRYMVKQNEQAFEAIRYQSVLFFNRKVLSNVGVDPDSIYTMWEKGQWTWSAFKNILLKVTAQKDANGKPKIWGSVNTNDDAQLWIYLIQSNGTDATKNVNGKMQFNIKDEKVIKALEFWRELCNEDLVYPALDNSTAPSFTQGNVAFIANYLDRLDNQQGIGYGAMKDDFGIVPFPKGPDATNYSTPVAFYDAYAIPTASLRGDKTKAKGLAAIINELCKPLYTESQEASNFRLQTESLVRDAGSLKVLNAMKSYLSATDFYEVFESGLHDFYSHVLLEQYVTGKMDTGTMIDTYYDEFNNKLLDKWTKK